MSHRHLRHGSPDRGSHAQLSQLLTELQSIDHAPHSAHRAQMQVKLDAHAITPEDSQERLGDVHRHLERERRIRQIIRDLEHRRRLEQQRHQEWEDSMDMWPTVY